MYIHITVLVYFLTDTLNKQHDIIGVHSQPPKIRSPHDTKAPGPPLIYLVGLLAILDTHISICVGPPNTCVALKQFNSLPRNALF